MPAFYTPGQNGLKQNWQGVCWMNPPYGSALRQWVGKRVKAPRLEQPSFACFHPARRDTYWWHEYVSYQLLVTVFGRDGFTFDRQRGDHLIRVWT